MFADSSWDGAMMARRLSAWSIRTSNGTLGLKAIALLRLAGSMARLKSRLRYADGSTPLSPSDGFEAESAGGPSVANDQWCRRV